MKYLDPDIVTYGYNVPMRHIRLWIIGILVLLLAGGSWLWLKEAQPQPIRIGVLHSLTGRMALYERPLVDALRFAVEEINASGGLLGRHVEMRTVDCRSDAAHCGREAERLIREEHVSALFGCWESTCRKAVRTVVERHRHLLFYPLDDEGMERSANIAYLGAAPNQQLIPAVRWALDTLGRRFYLLGSDFSGPRTAHLVMREIIEAHGGQVLGERLLPQEAGIIPPSIAAAVDELRRLQPDVVINTITGDANQVLFVALAGAGLSARELPVISTSIDENGALGMFGDAMTGHYAVWSYFQTLPGESNQRFVTAFRRRFGDTRVISDPMEVSYVGVKLWAQAVQKVGTDQPGQVGNAILKQSMAAPEGIVSFHEENRRLWRSAHIGRLGANRQFEIVWSSSSPICPEPYPTYRSRVEWDERLRGVGLR